LVGRWRRSGLSGPSFATREGIDTPSRRTRKQRHVNPVAEGDEAPPSEATMVRVEVRAPPPIETTCPSVIELLRNGWTVRVVRPLDLETLRKVLEEIESRTPC